MIGAGGVGLQVLAAAKLAGAVPLVAVDRDAAKLGSLANGARDHVVDTSTDERVVRTLRTLTDGGADHAFEVVGVPETMLLAWKAIRPGATAVVVGLAEKGVDVALPAIEFLSDKGIRGSYYGSGDPAQRSPRAGAAGARRRARPRGRRDARRHARRRGRGARDGSAAARARVPSSFSTPRLAGAPTPTARRQRMTTTTEDPRSVTDVVADLSIRAQAFIDGELRRRRLRARRSTASARSAARSSPRSRRATRPTSIAPSPARAPPSSRASGRGSRRRSASRRSSASPS